MGSLIRIWFNYFFINHLNVSNVRSVMIYGAGMAGRQIAAALKFNEHYQVKGFFDDNTKIHKLTIAGLKVFDPVNIKKIVRDKEITDIILAIPSLSNLKRHLILDVLEKMELIVKTVPHLSKILSGQMLATDILELNISDLLVRDLVEPIDHLLKLPTDNKVIAVTGAGGSIGSEICRQLLHCNPKKIVLIDLSEASLYKIDNELKFLIQNFKKKNDIEVISVIGSICSYERMKDIFSTFNPDTVYHAAAYKHVPLVE